MFKCDFERKDQPFIWIEIRLLAPGVIFTPKFIAYRRLLQETTEGFGKFKCLISLKYVGKAFVGNEGSTID